MALYDRLAQTVLRLLTKYGTSVQLRRFAAGGGGYSPATGSITPAGSAGEFLEPRKVLVADQPGTQISQRFGQTIDQGTLVQKAEKWMYMDAIGSAPKLQDHFVYQGTNYSVMDVQECGPGGIAVFYLLVLRS